jgi:apolipoprotein N-acyltransferase
MTNNHKAAFTRAIRGPVMLTLLGALFALGQWTPYNFHRTWPALLVVYGLLRLIGHWQLARERNAAFGGKGDGL